MHASPAELVSAARTVVESLLTSEDRPHTRSELGTVLGVLTALETTWRSFPVALRESSEEIRTILEQARTDAGLPPAPDWADADAAWAHYLLMRERLDTLVVELDRSGDLASNGEPASSLTELVEAHLRNDARRGRFDIRLGPQ